MSALATLPLVVESTNIVRRRVFQLSSADEIPDVLMLLKREKFTGCVTVNVAQGTCNTVAVEEKSSLSPL